MGHPYGTRLTAQRTDYRWRAPEQQESAAPLAVVRGSQRSDGLRGGRVDLAGRCGADEPDAADAILQQPLGRDDVRRVERVNLNPQQMPSLVRGDEQVVPEPGNAVAVVKRNR